MEPIPAAPKKKDAAPDAKVCASCLAPQGSAGVTKLSDCSRCGLVAYCSKDCQRAHWRVNHKQFCITKADRAPPQVPDNTDSVATAKAADAGDECVICLDSLTTALACTLPCAHVFHSTCVEGLRLFGVKQVCPMCRTELPPGPEKLFEEAVLRYLVVDQRVKRDEASWAALTKADQQEMDYVIRMWRESAGQGHPEAQCNMATLYNNGQGVKRDYAEAAKWWQKAAAQGIVHAQFNLGVAYDQGEGVKQNYAEAAKWWRKAADLEHAQSQFNLGVGYDQGLGVKRNFAEAAKWYRKAAENGNSAAQHNLAFAYAQGKGVKQDYAEAPKWWRKASDQGHAGSQCNLARAYCQGQGVKKNGAEAAKWYRKAADQGFAEAQVGLAQCYEEGWGLKKNHSKAVELLSLAAKQGHALAVQILSKFQPATTPSDPLIGARVQLRGIQAKPEMNGVRGVVRSFNEATGRYAVQLESDGQPFMLKAANFQRL